MLNLVKVKLSSVKQDNLSEPKKRKAKKIEVNLSKESNEKEIEAK